ncbi:hypothetical protein BSKO_11055 [Bryopsis sp. KO-2023]|nr:hypothetical protein BSKO_11055 [Bryopsis sp. KO-2023]
MEGSQQDVVGVVMRALSVLGSPTTSQGDKLSANEILSKVKASDVNTVLGIAIGLIERESAAENLIFAYHLLSEVTQQKWHECSASQQEGLATFASSMLKKGDPSNIAVQKALAHFSAVVLSRQKEDLLSTSWEHVLKFGEMEQNQRSLVCQMAQFLCEEGSSSANRTAQERHALLSALTKLAVPTFQFLTQVAELHYGFCMQETDLNVQEGHAKVVQASLAAMETWCELVPLRRVGEGQVLRACQALLTVNPFEAAVLGVLEKIVCRKDVNESDVPVGVDAGVLVMGHLRKYHDLHRQNALDFEDGEHFEKAFKTATVFCAFAESFYQFLGKGVGRPEPRDVVIEVLKLFDFRSIEINVTPLAFWKRFLSIKGESWRGFSAGMMTSTHWMMPIAKNLGVCLFRLKDHLRSVEEDDVVLHLNDSLKEFRGRHSQIVSACLATYTLLFPKIVIEYVGSLLREAVEICNHPGADEAARVAKMRALACTITPVTLGEVANMEVIPRMMAEVLEGIVKISVKEQINLGYWLGHAVRSCSKVVRMTEASCGVILPLILDILFGLPMPTVGLGPRLDNARSGALFDARCWLSGAIRQLVENSPASVRPHYAGFKEKIGQGNAAQRVTILEVTVFREVFILSSYSAPPALQKEVLDWAFGPVYASWSQKPWIRGDAKSPQNLTSFLQYYLPVEGRHPNGEVAVGGCQNRWDLFHELLLLSKVYSRHPRSVWRDRKKPPPTNSIDPLLELVAVVGNILRFVQEIFDPKNRGLLGYLEPILQLSKEEMEALSGMNKLSRQKDDDDESSRVGAPNLGSSRKWLTCIFDRSTRILMMVGKSCPVFWVHDGLCQLLPPLVSESVAILDMRFRRLLLHQVVIPWMATCPRWRRKVWIFPMLMSTLPSLRQSLMQEWANASSKDSQHQGQRTEFEEIVFDGLLREETVDVANLYCQMSVQQGEEGNEKTATSVFEGLISWNPSSCEIVSKLCIDLLQVPDSRVVSKMIQFARLYISISESSKDMQNVVVGEMLHSLLKLLFDGNMETQAMLILAGIAEILIRHESNTTVHQCLLKLPGFSNKMLRKLQSTLPTKSEKKQKDFLAQILSSACGSQLLALTPKENVKKVTGVAEPRPRPKPAPSFFD